MKDKPSFFCGHCCNNTLWKNDHCCECGRKDGSEIKEPVETKAKSSHLSTQVDGDHYKKLAIQPIEYSVKNKLGFAEGNAIKYITRHRDKNGKVDLEKAIHCLQLLIELEYGESAKSN